MKFSVASSRQRLSHYHGDLFNFIRGLSMQSKHHWTLKVHYYSLQEPFCNSNRKQFFKEVPTFSFVGNVTHLEFAANLYITVHTNEFNSFLKLHENTTEQCSQTSFVPCAVKGAITHKESLRTKRFIGVRKDTILDHFYYYSRFFSSI